MDTVAYRSSGSHRSPVATSMAPHASGATLLFRQTAAHRVLHSDELLRMIIRFVSSAASYTDEECEAKATLASLAVVSSALSEPALEELWSFVPDIGPLLLLCDASTALQVPTPERSPRLFKYTSCIKGLILMSGKVPESLLDPSLHVMFPRLQELHWNVFFNPFVQPFSQFVVPGLKTLNIDIDLPIAIDTPSETDEESGAVDEEVLTELKALPDVLAGTVMDALCAAKARSSTTLTDLRLYWANIPLASPAEGIINVIQSLTRLESLYLDVRVLACSRDALCIFSTLPVLKTLEIVNPGQLPVKPLHLNPVHDGFAVLDKLTLELPALHALYIFLRLSQCALSLGSCRVILIGEASHEVQLAIAESVMGKFRRATPHAILFDFSNYDEFKTTHRRSVISPISPVVFPYLCAMSLVDVRLRKVAPGTVTDALCALLAKAWPRLRKLYLHPDFYADFAAGNSNGARGSLLTLRGLRSFAEGCPDLSNVIIMLDAAGEHWADEAQSLRQLTSPRPVKLRLGMSPVTSATAVAVYLSRCFSSIKRLQFGENDGPPARREMPFQQAEWKCLRALLLHGP
ncbi:hypothetical protein C8Q80DRAFT_1144527 [Daedaleopsis nitida]|nr:hypothetical protein C8Q80DRAFT_1144527 [Daedaleopsis nitida]